MRNPLKIEKLLLYTVVLVGLVIPAITYAQLPDISSSISFNVTPRYVEPADQVTISVESFVLDLNRASITWRKNGTEIASGGTEKEIMIEAGPLGTRTSIEAVIRTETGMFVSKNITIQPSLVDLIWEVDTYTPHFYKGKALPGAGSAMRIEAIAEFVDRRGNRIDPDDMIYTWRKNGAVLGGDSGRGRSTLFTEGPLVLGQIKIDVLAESVNDQQQARIRTTIPYAAPLLLLYEQDPLLGMRYETAIVNIFEIEKEEMTISAHPFHFSGMFRYESKFSYRWRLNNEEIDTTSGDASSITLRPEGGSGEALIQLSLKNTDNVFEQAQGLFTVLFRTVSTSVLPSL